jgi:ParB family chromosome partitioning protein
MLLPLAAIDATAIPRDRTALDPGALATLQRSILAEGLRQPIEVYALSIPTPPVTHGLISGLRRLSAFRALAETFPRFAEIPCTLREPQTMAQAMTAMVTENEVRAEISPWEKANLILTAVENGHFDTPDAAIAGLFPYIDKSARSRLRSVAQVVGELDGALADGPGYSLRQLLRLSTALKAGYGEVIEAALREHHDRTPAVQWALLQNILTEAELSLQDPVFEDKMEVTRKRLSRPHPRGGLTIRREWLPNGWRLVFTGPEAKGMMIESVMRDIELKYGPPGR